MLKISIITINYNDASGLKRTLDSIFDQTYPGFESIVIDGKSDDGSLETIGKFKSHSIEIALLRIWIMSTYLLSQFLISTNSIKMAELGESVFSPLSGSLVSQAPDRNN